MNLLQSAEDLKQRGIKPNSKVSWRYLHYLGRTCTWRTKHGRYLGLVAHKPQYQGRQLASVLFEGNKRETSVPAEELLLGDGWL